MNPATNPRSDLQEGGKKKTIIFGGLTKILKILESGLSPIICSSKTICPFYSPTGTQCNTSNYKTCQYFSGGKD